MRRRPRRIVPSCAVVGLLALSTASCSETYLAHRETLSRGSGDAIEGDIAKQVIDPWPAAAFQNQLTTSGERLQHAMERYNDPSSGTPSAIPNASPVSIAK